VLKDFDGLEPTASNGCPPDRWLRVNWLYDEASAAQRPSSVDAVELTAAHNVYLRG